MEHVIKVIAILVMLISVTAVMGNVFGLTRLITWGYASAGMSVPTGASLVLLAIAVWVLAKRLPDSNGVH